MVVGRLPHRCPIPEYSPSAPPAQVKKRSRNRSGRVSGDGKVDSVQGSQRLVPSLPTSDSECRRADARPVAWNCQYSPAVSLIRPVMSVVPTRRVGAADNGRSNDALSRMRESLTVGRR